MAETNLKAIGDNSNPQDASRKIQITDLADNQERKVYLTIVGYKNHPCIKLPLARKSIPTKFGDEPDEWPLVLVPYRLRAKGLKAADVSQFKPTLSTSDEYHIEPSKLSDGFLYVFVNGYLWRELEVEQHESGDTYYYDIDLLTESKKSAGNNDYLYTIFDVQKKKETDYKYRIDDRDVRVRAGKRDNRLVLPYVKTGSSAAKVQVCFSRIQWSWLWIETMGGVCPKGKTRDDWFLDDVATENATGKERRAKRCHTVPLGDYKNGFDQVGDIGPVGMSNTFTYNIDYDKKIPFLDMDDPIGIALKLKSDHVAAYNDFEKHTEVMGDREYPLAVIVDQIVKSEEKSNAAAKKLDPEFDDKTRFKGRVNQPKIDRSIKYWKESNKKKEKLVVDVGKLVIWWMQEQNCTQGGVHLVFVEMLKNNNPLRFSMGVSAWTELIEGLDFEEAHAYLKVIEESKDGITGEIGKLINNPTKAQLSIMQRLEIGDLPKNDERWTRLFGTRELVAAADYGNKVIRDTVKALTLTSLKKGGKDGLTFVSKLVKRYLPSIEVVLTHGPAFSRYATYRMVSPDVYTVRAAASDEFKKTNVFYLKMKHADSTKKIGDIAKDSKTFKLIVGVRVVIEIINVAVFWGTICEKWKTNKKVTSGDWVSLGEAVVGAIEGITGMAKDMMAEEQKHRAANQAKAERNYARYNRNPPKSLSPAMQRKLPNIKNNYMPKLMKLSVARTIARESFASWIKWRNIFAGINTFTSHVSAITKAMHGTYKTLKALEGGNYAQAAGGLTESAGGFMVSIGVHALWRIGLGLAIGVTAPVAIILIVLGLIAYFIGGFIYRYFKESDLEKAVNYCYFGAHPYAHSSKPDGYIAPYMLSKPYTTISGHHKTKRIVRYRSQPLKELVSINQYKGRPTRRQRNPGVGDFGSSTLCNTFFTEIQQIYRSLFQYQVTLKVRKISNGQGRWANGNLTPTKTDWFAITADIKFARLLTHKSTFFVSFKITTDGGYIELNKKDLILKETKNSEGMVTGLSFTYLIKNSKNGKMGFPHRYFAARYICEVEMRSMLDINGDGNHTVPVNLAVKKKGQKEKSNDQAFYMKTLFDENVGDTKWIQQSTLKNNYGADLAAIISSRTKALRLSLLQSSVNSICEYEENKKHNMYSYSPQPFAMYVDPSLTCASAKQEIATLQGWIDDGSSCRVIPKKTK